MGDKSLFEPLKDKFDTFMGKRGMDVRNINDKNVIFGM
jgi:hypothetical protein